MIALWLAAWQCAWRNNQERTGKPMTGQRQTPYITFEGGDRMTTRRNFLKGAAASGIAFCSCGMLDAARAQPGPMHLPVKVGGKRIMTVDAHAHC
jgi:hypothetical protein